MYLTKTDLKLANTCGTKLYYSKMRYPSALTGNDYLEFLADGGYMVEKIARNFFPEGQEIIADDDASALLKTTLRLTEDRVTLFEASVQAGNLFARTDILTKNGSQLEIREVKSKSFDSSTPPLTLFRTSRGEIRSGWQTYLEDITFQVLVWRRAFPELEVRAFLGLVDKAVVCRGSLDFRRFQLIYETCANGRRRMRVEYHGDPADLVSDPIVNFIDVTGIVGELLPQVAVAADKFAASLTSWPPVKIAPEPGIHCKHCEFRNVVADEQGRHGFRDCWQQLADPDPHLFDLFRVDTLGTRGTLARELIQQGKTSLFDVPADACRGAYGIRQKLQLEYSRTGEEFISPHLPEFLRNHRYPLHFVDFEASRLAIPYHRGMRPYGQVAFQWSCHTIPEPGGDLEHREWINVEDGWPNGQFADTLRSAVGREGTVFIWSKFERTTLQEIRTALEPCADNQTDLLEWLDWMCREEGPLVDLMEYAQEHYFHPEQKGSLSIKHVLPAVWSASPGMRSHPWFSAYHREQNGRLLSPYETLPPLEFVDEEQDEDGAVRDGTAAMRTYQEMMYGSRREDEARRTALKNALLNYCRLDTLAMVMIWMRWSGLAEAFAKSDGPNGFRSSVPGEDK